MEFIVVPKSSQNALNAQSIARKLALRYSENIDEATLYPYVLIVTDDFLGIQIQHLQKKPFYIDFNHPTFLYRLKQANLRNELIARAMGAKPSEEPTIVDATAGLGRDSLILAFLGYELTLLERSPILYTMLENGLERAKRSPTLCNASNRLKLHLTDAITWLEKLKKTESPEIIYLDPMFPMRQKTASVKKEMIILQNLIGTDPDAKDLLEVALACAKKRVVVKRPRLSLNIGDYAPNFTLTGKKNRFDVYLT